jgi:putative ABC transport system permease protein
MFPVDGNFLKTYGFTMANGRFFNIQLASDSNALVINEALANQLKWDNPMAKTIKFQEDGEAFNIIGVMKDFNYHSLYEEVEPMVMWISNNNRANISIRFAGNPSSLLAGLESKWKTFEPRAPFHYYFVDQALAKNYEADDKLFKTVIAFAGISIFIACLGLYGLVSFIIENRTKEFGIRRVFGASVTGLNFMVNKKFMVLVLIASVVAVPIIIPLIEKWLSKFAFRIDVGPFVFIEAVLITGAITLASVSIQAVRAAMMSPAESLKHE